MIGTDYRGHLLLLLLGLLLATLLRADVLTQDVQGYHTWRQSMTMQMARGFLLHDANILNPTTARIDTDTDRPKVFRMEFPAVPWSIGMAQRAFGDRIVVARVVMLLFGALAVVGMFFLCLRIGLGADAGLVTALLLAFSGLFHYHSISFFSDILALAASIWYLAAFISYVRAPTARGAWITAAWLGLAALVKLPFVLYGIASVVFFLREIVRRRRLDAPPLLFAGAHLLLALPALAWYLAAVPTWQGNEVVTSIFSRNIAYEKVIEIATAHLTFIWPFLILSPLALPLAVIGAVRATRRHWRGRLALPLLGLPVLTFLYFFLEFDLISFNHDYYMFPFQPWLYVLVGFGAYWLLAGPYRTVRRWLAVGALAGLLFLSHGMVRDRWTLASNYDYERPMLVHRRALSNAIPDDEPVIMLNDRTFVQFPYAVRKYGYTYRDDGMRSLWIQDLYEKQRVRYLYSNSRTFEARPDIYRHFAELVLEAGNVRLWKLRSIK